VIGTKKYASPEILRCFIYETKKNLTIIDFGASKNIHQALVQSTQSKINITVIGTKKYASPEILRCFMANDEEIITNLMITAGGTGYLKVMNPYKSDAFSFGLIIFELWKLMRINNAQKQEEFDLTLIDLKKKVKEEIIEPKIKRKLMLIINILAKCLIIDPDK